MFLSVSKELSSRSRAALSPLPVQSLSQLVLTGWVFEEDGVTAGQLGDF